VHYKLQNEEEDLWFLQEEQRRGNYTYRSGIVENLLKLVVIVVNMIRHLFRRANSIMGKEYQKERKKKRKVSYRVMMNSF
jgi:hypothetical protein